MTAVPCQQGIRHLVERHVPGEVVHSITPLGEGLDNAAWLVNDELVIRQAKDPNADANRREVALLAVVGHHSPIPVPQIVFAGPESGIIAYRMLPGRPCIDLPRDAEPADIAESLGRFLAAIHAIPLPEVESLVERDDDPLADWLGEAREGYPQIANSILPSFRPRIETVLAEPPPPEPETLTFCHNDLGAEHILVDPATGRVTGIIDWTDAAIADPVRDLALIFRDFGPDTLSRTLAAYGRTLSSDEHERLLFHARCKLLEDIAFGIETGSSHYVDAAIAHLAWVFG